MSFQISRKKKKKRKKQIIDFLITVPTGTEFSANIIMVTAPGHWQGLQQQGERK